MKFINYSDKFLEKVGNVLGFQKSTIIFWQIRWPLFMDARKTFVQTEEEDKVLMGYYGKLIVQGMSTMQKAKVIATAVNSRISYVKDKDNFGVPEYWAKPIDIHNNKTDDCEGYACLMTYVLRLFGAQPWEVFVRAGEFIDDAGKTYGHGTCIVLNLEDMKFYPIEGSTYPQRTMSNFGKVSLQDNQNYGDTWFITNDLLSFSKYPIKLASK